MLFEGQWGPVSIALVVVLPIITLVVGALIGFFVAQKVLKKQLKENPPITREQIKAMYQQMGRTPSESQINQIMETMKKNQD